MDFEGFPKKGIRFLAQVARNNDRAWFEAHKKEYQEFVLEPARDFVDALGHRLRQLGKVHFEPRVNGSIFRIARDTRFSKDKRPYKEHQDLWFWEGRDRKASPGYWFSLRPKTLALGAGLHGFDAETLARYRRAVVDERAGATLAGAWAIVRKAGPYQLGGRNYKRVPRGFDPDHPRAEFLLYDSLFAWIELPLPPEVHTPELVDVCFTHYRTMAPIERWVVALTG